MDNILYIGEYRVIKTTMYPKSWKIEHVGFQENNSWTEFFKTREEAVAEILRRGG